MKLRLSKKDKSIFGAFFVIILLTTAAAQFLFVQPLQAELVQKKQSLQTEQKLLETIQQKKGALSENTVVSTTELQKKMPVQPLVDQLILDLEKAEVVSNSTIKSMAFSSDASTVEEGTIEAAPTEAPPANTEGQETTTETTDAVATTETAVDPAVASALPAGVKKVSVELSIESPSYEDLEKFIATLESMKRISVVAKIDFTGGDEITTLEDEDEPLVYTLSLTAFYMPDLKDLQDHLPELATPAPANKRNPLSKFSDVSTTSESDDSNQ
ncbi:MULTISPECIES: hypothetical protein [unclassified Bacillus (in: firmicutes)]|uniref:hypothetical protein n=1 Tax=unclassified Bacillus (in: firmicutes) TaxID=185979 RepID=UPI0008ED043E|nr:MULTISPECIES: hypothetical protein [unclassified Bacillus (in: firmicutes)]SFB16245.1 type IV pilus assembly protein PilO [Bacillus sp. UNCCL13]SFQ78194.1 type IV pilus assembly protein PilO [Bacillus sp. cl95]